MVLMDLQEQAHVLLEWEILLVTFEFVVFRLIHNHNKL